MLMNAKSTNAVRHIEVECYGTLVAICGSPSLHITLNDKEDRVHDVINTIARQQPAAAPVLARSAVARGDCLIGREDTVEDGECLALIPPVSGG